MHKNYLFIYLILLPLAAFSQSTTSPFFYNKVNLGVVREDAGIQYVSYQFNRKKSAGFKIDTVITSCGCLATRWTKSIDADTGHVLVEFNPLNRPGVIYKEIDVVTHNDTIKLMLTGTVVPIKEKDLELNYREQVGCLHYTSKAINFGEIYSNQKVEKSFLLYNACDAPITMNDSLHVFPSYISYSFDTNKVEPHSFINLKLVYDPLKANDWGYKTDQIILSSSQKKNKTIDLSIHATILEFFEENPQDYPFIKFDTTHLQMGTLKEGQSYKHEFGFKNIGKDTLIIRKIQSTCSCLHTEIKDKIIPPGETSVLAVDFFTNNRSGTQKKYVYVISNSPYSSVTEIVLTGKVVD